MTSPSDPARLKKPSDPWLGEAPTSSFSEVAPVPSYYVAPPVPDDLPPRRRSRAIPLVLALLITAALVVAGVLIFNRHDTAAPTPPAEVAEAPVVVTHEIVYEVTASGDGNTGSVSYVDQDGDIIRRSGIKLPWRTTFRRDGKATPLVLDAQRHAGGDAGPVTCTITVDGKVLATTTAKGRYAAVEC